MRSYFEIRHDMWELQASHDPEDAHIKADALLIEAILKLTDIIGGDPTLWPKETEDLIASWNKVPRWYA